MAIADGARGSMPPISLGWEALPVCIAYRNILPPLEWTASLTNFQPSLWASEYIPAAVDLTYPSSEIYEASVKIRPALALSE